MILEQLKLDQNEMEMLEHIVKQMETERVRSKCSNRRHEDLILLRVYVNRPLLNQKKVKNGFEVKKIDRVLTGKYTAIPCFVGIMVLVFYLTFNVIGAWLQGILQLGIDKILSTYRSGINCGLT